MLKILLKIILSLLAFLALFFIGYFLRVENVDSFFVEETTFISEKNIFIELDLDDETINNFLKQIEALNLADNSEENIKNAVLVHQKIPENIGLIRAEILAQNEDGIFLDSYILSFKKESNLRKTILLMRDFERKIIDFLQENNITTESFFAKKWKNLKTKKGEFILEYIDPLESNLQKYYLGLKKSDFFQKRIDILNDSFILERDVTIKFDACFTANAYYDEIANEVVMCYEIFDFIESTFLDTLSSQDDIDKKVFYSILGIFNHELGHAFVANYDLSHSGREEDVVDQFGTIIQLEFFADSQELGQKIIVNSARFFHIIDYSLDFKEINNYESLSGPHSIGAQRYYDNICLLYGFNQIDNKFYINQSNKKFVVGKLNKNRAISCQKKYLDTSNLFYNFFNQYLK